MIGRTQKFKNIQGLQFKRIISLTFTVKSKNINLALECHFVRNVSPYNYASFEKYP